MYQQCNVLCLVQYALLLMHDFVGEISDYGAVVSSGNYRMCLLGMVV